MGQRGPKARREAGPGQGLAPKVPVPLAAVQQSNPKGESWEAAAKVVTVLCQLEMGGGAGAGGIPGVPSPGAGPK